MASPGTGPSALLLRKLRRIAASASSRACAAPSRGFLRGVLRREPRREIERRQGRAHPAKKALAPPGRAPLSPIPRPPFPAARQAIRDGDPGPHRTRTTRRGEKRDRIEQRIRKRLPPGVVLEAKHLAIAFGEFSRPLCRRLPRRRNPRRRQARITAGARSNAGTSASEKRDCVTEAVLLLGEGGMTGREGEPPPLRHGGSRSISTLRGDPFRRAPGSPRSGRTRDRAEALLAHRVAAVLAKP